MRTAEDDRAPAEHVLVLGSNRQRARNFRLAWQALQERFEVLACAPPLRTRDRDGVRYLNAAVRIRSSLPPGQLRQVLQTIEDQAGRVRGAPLVALDIDLVASRDADAAVMVHKPEDLQRDYVRALLARIGFP